MTSLHHPSVIAVFDFDHTITNRDSLLPFLFYTTGSLKTYYYLFKLIPYFIGFIIGIIPRQRIKEKILETFFKGWSFIHLQKIGEDYAKQILDEFVKEEAIDRLRWHQQQGHYCLLVSASLEFYLEPWAKEKGFDQVLASRLELNSFGQVTGKLEGLNCWGPEKKRRLFEWLGKEHDYVMYAYGDSRGDKELLEMAAYPFYRKFF